MKYLVLLGTGILNKYPGVRFNEVFVYSKVHRPHMRQDGSSREKVPVVVQDI